MKTAPYYWCLLLLMATKGLFAQKDPSVQKDTLVSFKVYGVCAAQCKPRIEAASKGRGVRTAEWNVDSKMLSVEYDPTRTTLDNIQKRIVAAGHDLENRKAKDAVYNELPACCRYRAMDSLMNEETASPGDTERISGLNVPTLGQGSHIVKGVVLESNKKGGFAALPGASIAWLGSTGGVVTDSSGAFAIQHLPGANKLVVSYAGYSSDTLALTDMNELKIVLGSNNRLKEVVVTSKQRSAYVSALNPIRTQIMTDKELFKAACCNLSESFETNPSVDVSYNDAVTGSKQIQLLGLSGNYTQLTVENLPGPRGIATPLGLNSIAGPWVESIQLTKGIGSVANGYESIAGQINVELKKPENSERLYANAYVNDFGKTDLNINLSQKIGKKWSTALLLHDDFITNKNLDVNSDGFRDLPTGNQFNFINRWKYDDGKGLLAQVGLKVLNDRRTGGETAFNPSSDKNTTNHYGLGINTDRYELFGKIGYVFPQKKYKSIGLQLSAIDHTQSSFFGLNAYDARQKSLYSNLIYQSIINNTNHKFRTGISFLYDNYNEYFITTDYKRTQIVPGAFFEYTYTYSEKFSAVAGIRIDHDNLFGFFVTPRVHIRYEPFKGTVIRASAGRGQRTANIFAENTSVFVSSRQVNIIDAAPGKAYGLNPEVAWNKGITFDQKFRLFYHDADISVDFFRNDFSSQVVVDLENAREVKFYNLVGESYSNSFQASFNFEPLKDLEIRFAYRYFDVKTTYSGKLLPRPLIATNRAFANVSYSSNGWKFDYTLNYNGKKRIPDTKANPAMYQLEEYSPSFVTMNAQISKTVGKKKPIDFYIGAENISNYYQKNAIVAADQPFSAYFDASMIWGPISGRMFYAGCRYKIK